MKARITRSILLLTIIALPIIVYLGLVYGPGLAGDRPSLIYFYVKT